MRLGIVSFTLLLSTACASTSSEPLDGGNADADIDSPDDAVPAEACTPPPDAARDAPNEGAACTGNGQEWSPKQGDPPCCAGLLPANVFSPTQGCDSSPPDIFVCIACGDGVCGAGENRCNCCIDCH